MTNSSAELLYDSYDNDDYFKLLSNWPWHQHDHPKKKIAVIGAGMSGLTAAWLLVRAGHTNIRIFEASNVVGGRVKTLRDRLTSGFNAEAGAMRIPQKSHRLTNWLLDNFLDPNSMTEFEHDCKDALIYINNVHRSWADYQGAESGRAFNFDLSPSEHSHTARDLFEALLIAFVRDTPDLAAWHGISDFSVLLDGIERRNNSASRTFFQIMDQYSLHQFLLQEGRRLLRFTPGAIDYIVALLVYEMHLSASMASLMSDYREVQRSESLRPFRQITLGMDHLPRCFVGTSPLLRDLSKPTAASPALNAAEFPDLGPYVSYNSRVTDIEYQPEDDQFRIALNWKNTITHVPDSDDNFDLVIISAPFAALRHVRMNSAYERQQAASSAPVAIRQFLQNHIGIY